MEVATGSSHRMSDGCIAVGGQAKAHTAAAGFASSCEYLLLDLLNNGDA